MRRCSSLFCVGSALLLFGLGATVQAQVWKPYEPGKDREDRSHWNNQHADYDDNDDQRRDVYRDSRYEDGDGGSSNGLIGRVLSDLDRLSYGSRIDGHEKRHVEEASRKLYEFHDRVAQGRFDNGKLDKAIENIQHLA